ncbi:MAG: RNA methyltransferase [Clostridioides sp.]|jgi:TrmH family RNA methyltransferase|nr:RNA methyltransferase [Clostridioides sp.]
MIKMITSRDNDRLKYTRSLLKSKNRFKENKFIIEGYRIATLAIEQEAPVEYVVINEDFEEKDEHIKLIKDFEDRDIEIYKTTNKNFKEIVDTENTQGIVAVSKFEKKDINKGIMDSKFIVILDRIQDPGNMGTIIRTADAAGVDTVVVLKGSVDVYNPKVIRSTMGSIFSMDIVFAEEDVIDILKANGFNIVSSYLGTDNYYDKVDYGEKVALVIGNEANGISDEIIEMSDILVKIPMYGNAESLNAGISSAILLYEIRKKFY